MSDDAIEKREYLPVRKKESSERGFIAYYLVTIHNLVQAVGWVYILFLVIQHIIYENLFVLQNKQIMVLTMYIQALQINDVLFGLVGFTKTSILQSILQNLGRNTIAWLVFPVVVTSNYPAVCLLVWCPADIIRFSSYLNDAFGSKVPLLKTLRYNAFILLYPIGAAGEFFSVLHDMPGLKSFVTSKFGDDILSAVFYGSLVAYPYVVFPGLLFNYTSLLRARAKFYREQKALPKKKQTEKAAPENKSE